LQHQPIYEALAHQQGVVLPGSESREHFARMLVSDVLREDQPIAEESELIAIADRLKEPSRNAWPVVNASGLSGLMTRSQLLQAETAVSAGDVIVSQPSFPYVYPDQPLSLALEKMGDAGIDVLPVVSRANSRKLLGIVTLSETLDAYGVGRGS
jgi:CIC family chloride channel protein